MVENGIQDGCGSCKVSSCSAKGVEPQSSALRGSTFMLASFLVFLGPVILAIAGALLGSQSATQQFLGSLGGFGLGMLISTVVQHIISRGKKGGIGNE